VTTSKAQDSESSLSASRNALSTKTRRKQSEQHQQAMTARIEELERVASSQAEQLESAHRQAQMLQTLVDDLHTALQSKEDSVRTLQKRLDDSEVRSPRCYD
jgi:chromosome segregation ATPase